MFGDVAPKKQVYRGWTITTFLTGGTKRYKAKPPSTHAGQWPRGFGISSISGTVDLRVGALKSVVPRIDRLIRYFETPKYAPLLPKGERVPPGYQRDVGGRRAPKYPYGQATTRGGMRRSRVRRVSRVKSRQTVRTRNVKRRR